MDEIAMTIINSVDGKYAVEIIPYGEKVMACAVSCDRMSYSGNSYWFTIGTYKTIETDTKKSVKQMAIHNIELLIPCIPIRHFGRI